MDLCIRIRVRNMGPDAASLDVLPTLWWRNRWSWDEGSPRPDVAAEAAPRPEEAFTQILPP